MRHREWKKEIVKAALREYRAFKRETLRKGKGHIWKDSWRIDFYGTAMEYFQCCYTGECGKWQVLRGMRQPIRAMWECYHRQGYMEYNTWQGIERILEAMEAERGTRPAVTGQSLQ